MDLVNFVCISVSILPALIVFNGIIGIINIFVCSRQNTKIKEQNLMLVEQNKTLKKVLSPREKEPEK